MPQVGLQSTSFLRIHNHGDDDQGGPILSIARAASVNVKIGSWILRSTAPGVGAWAMMKRILIRQDSLGTMNINFMMTREGGAGIVHGQARIYRAGALIWSGVDNNTAAGPTIYTDAAIAVNLLKGDLVEIWGYVSAGAAAVCTIEDMELCWTTTITEISAVDLTAPLAVSIAGILYTVIL